MKGFEGFYWLIINIEGKDPKFNIYNKFFENLLFLLNFGKFSFLNKFFENLLAFLSKFFEN